jgi:hypothetical protein
VHRDPLEPACATSTMSARPFASASTRAPFGARSGLRNCAASAACAVAQPRANSSASGASASPIAVAANASPSVSTVNTPRLVSPYWPSGSEIAQYQIGIDTYATTIPAAVTTQRPSVKPTSEVTPSQARSFHVCESELTVLRSGTKPRVAGRRYTAPTRWSRCHPARRRSTHVVQRTTYAKPIHTNTPITKTRSEAVTDTPVTRIVKAAMLHTKTAPA